MARSVPEWVGVNDDAKVPPRVRVRIFERHNGICHLSGIKIAGKKWELEHIKPLHMGGEHRERNLAPALIEPHKIKSAAERRVKAKADQAAKKHLGAVAPKQPIKSAPLPQGGARKINPMPGLPPRALYVEQ